MIQLDEYSIKINMEVEKDSDTNIVAKCSFVVNDHIWLNGFALKSSWSGFYLLVSEPKGKNFHIVKKEFFKHLEKIAINEYEKLTDSVKKDVYDFGTE